jgi:hypothetical protein
MAESHGHDIGYCGICNTKVIVMDGKAATHWLMDHPFPWPPCGGSGEKATGVVEWTDTRSKAKTGKC